MFLNISHNLKLNLSPKIVFPIILGVILFIFKSKTEIDIFDFFFMFTFVLLFLDIIWLGLNYLLSKKINFRRDIPSKLLEEDKLEIKIILDNPNFFPSFGIEVSDYLSCADKDKEKIFVLDFVKPEKIYQAKYGCTCKHRGKYLIGPLRLAYPSFLGFFKIETINGPKKVLYVYPKTFKIETVPALTRGVLPWFGLETMASSGDEDEFFGLREYKKGDSLKRIHWFSTARKGQLIVREFQKCNFYQVSLIFLLNRHENLGKGEKSVSEYMIKIAASLSKYFIDRDICTGLLSHAGKVCSFLPNKGPNYLEEMFKFYAEAKAESYINMQDFIREHYNLIPSDSTLFIIVTEKNIDILIKILSLREKNVSIVALVVLAYTFLHPSERENNFKSIKENIVTRMANANIKVLFFEQNEPLEKEFLK